MRIHLLGQARSGTTYLYNVIRQHYVTKQQVDFGNEPFNSDFRDSSTFSEHLNLIAQTPRAIIKNHTLHLPQMPPEELDRLKELMDFTVVVWRPNIFELTASLCVSVTKDQWYANQQDIKPIKFGSHSTLNSHLILTVVYSVYYMHGMARPGRMSHDHETMRCVAASHLLYAML